MWSRDCTSGLCRFMEIRKRQDTKTVCVKLLTWGCICRPTRTCKRRALAAFFNLLPCLVADEQDNEEDQADISSLWLRCRTPAVVGACCCLLLLLLVAAECFCCSTLFLLLQQLLFQLLLLLPVGPLLHVVLLLMLKVHVPPFFPFPIMRITEDLHLL